MADHPTFTEHGPYEKGFAEVFAREIAPKLKELERERLVLFNQRKIRLLATIAATAVGAITAIVLMNAYWNSIESDQWIGKILIFSIPAVMPFFAGRWWMRKLHKLHASSLRDVIADAACGFFGDLTYHRDIGERFDQKRFTDLGVVPSGSFTRSEDLFSGRYRDTDYKMIDASVYQSSGKSGRTVFDGLLFEIDVPLEFSGRVLIGRDVGRVANALNKFFKGKFGKKEERVIFEHPAFEERYAVYASDPDEARRLITPGFCDTMVALAETHDTKSLGAAFVDGVFLLAVPVEGDLFEPGSITRSVYDCEDDIHEFLEHLTLAQRVIDYLYGDHPTVQAFEAGAKHAAKTEAGRGRKKLITGVAVGVGVIVLLAIGFVIFVSLQKKKTAETPGKIQLNSPAMEESADYGFAPLRLALAILEGDERVVSTMGTPSSPARLRIDDSRAAGPEGRVTLEFDVAGLTNNGHVKTHARKCDGAWWVETVTIIFAKPVEPPLGVEIDSEIAPPLAEFRRRVAAAGYASLDAAAAYGDAQRIIDGYSGRFCDLVAARGLLFEAARAAPDGANAYIGMGRLAYKAAYHSGDKYNPEGLKRAQTYFAAALDIDATAFDAYLYRGYAHLYAKDFARARADAERLRALNPASVDSDLLFAEIAVREKDYDQAETNAKSVIANPGGDTKLLSDAYGVLKRVYRARKQYDLAETTYLKLIELNPKSPWALSNYSLFLSNRGAYDKAIEFGEKALALSDFGMAHRILADAYYAKGYDLHWEQKKYEAAKPYFAGAIEHDAYHANAHYGLGMSYYWTGYNDKNVPDLDRAEIHLLRALELKPGHEQATDALVQLRDLFAWLDEEGLR